MFVTARDAKEFLVSRIVSEAQRESVSLSEIERKMMYFSETAWTLPDMDEVNRAFDRDYDQGEYEQKITKLARAARANAKADGSEGLGACEGGSSRPSAGGPLSARADFGANNKRPAAR